MASVGFIVHHYSKYYIQASAICIVTKKRINLANTKKLDSSNDHRLLEYVLQNALASKMEEQVLFCRQKSHFIAFLVPSDDGITIVTAENNLGNILDTWGIPFREVNKFSFRN